MNSDWIHLYREARDATTQIIQARLEQRSAEDGRRCAVAFRFDLCRNAAATVLFTRYRKSRNLSFREFRQKLEDGSFWEDFLEFLQSIDWEEVISLIITLIDAILKIIGTL